MEKSHFRWTTFRGAGQELVDRSDINTESPQYNEWVRSQALVYRGTATLAKTHDWSLAFSDIEKSAEIGNLQALRLLMENYLGEKSSAYPFGSFRPPDTDKSKAFFTAADLIDAYALRKVTDGSVELNVSAEQKLFWKLMYLAKPIDDSSQSKEIFDLIKNEGESKLGTTIAQYGLVGAPFGERTGIPSIPGRDVLATVFAELNLRIELVRSLGAHTPLDRTQIPEAPTVMENFLFLSTLVGEAGLADMYLLVPGKPETRQNNVHLFDREAIVDELRAGDIVWVGCGPFSHTAWVFAIDRNHDSIKFVDANYEFWKPSHNSCVKTLSFEHFRYGYSSPTLKLSDVAPMIEAVGTLRTAEPIGLAGDVSTTLPTPSTPSSATCSEQETATALVGQSASKIQRSDLIEFFQLIQTTSQLNSNGLSVNVLRPGTARFYGNVAVLVASDSKGCVRSMSLILRRSFLLRIA